MYFSSILLIFSQLYAVILTVMWFLKSPLNLKLSLFTFNLSMILKVT
jgi:hypothetical protein